MQVYPNIENDDEIIDCPESLSPPPYSSQSSNSDWKYEIIEVKSLKDRTNRYGFSINGGRNRIKDPWIVISHIDSPSNYLTDNGRHQLRLFDRILAVNDINFDQIHHDNAVRVFADNQQDPIKLYISRLNPRNIESIDVTFPSDSIERPLGVTISGGLDNNNQNDPGLFITRIKPNGFLGSYKQFSVNDRLLEIKTNSTSVNLQWLTHSRAIDLIKRICLDDRHVTFVVSHK